MTIKGAVKQDRKDMPHSKAGRASGVEAWVREPVNGVDARHSKKIKLSPKERFCRDCATD